MSSVGVLARTRHLRRVERAQRAVVWRSWAAAGHSRWQRLLGLVAFGATCLLLPGIVIVAAASGADKPESGLSPSGLLAAAAVVLGSGHRFQATALSFAAREVLFLPDKASVLLARLLGALPLQLATGVAWALACWLHLRHVGVPGGVAGLVAGGMVATMAPTAWAVGRLLARLHDGDGGSSLVPAAILAGAVAWLLELANWRPGDLLHWCQRGLMLAWAVGGFAGLVWAWRRPRRAWRSLGPELVRLPRLAVLFVLMAPASWLAASGLVLGVVLAGVAALLLLPFALRAVLVAVREAEAETGGSAIQRPSHPQDLEPATGPVPASKRSRGAAGTPVLPHLGRAPWRAARRIHRLQHGRWWLWPLCPGGLVMLGLLAQAVWHCHAWRQGSLLMLHGVTGVEVGRWQPAALLVGLFAPTIVGRSLSWQAYQWGVDWGTQVRHRLLAVLLAASAACSFTAALSMCLGWSEAHALLLATIAATFLMREGWCGFAPRGEFATLGSHEVLAIVALLVLSIFVPIATWPTIVAAASLGLVGIVVRIARWHEPTLAAAFAETRSGS